MTDAQIAALMGWSEEHMSRNDGPKSLEARVRALVDAAVAAESERCAKLCESARFTGNTFPRTQMEQLRMDIAAAIRGN